MAEGGDVVLLSPGCTSFDMYRDFAERGDHFKALVRELKNSQKRVATTER
jgi:UDP-N-acetylmuramoylalanine--D-glutamate ligase